MADSQSPREHQEQPSGSVASQEFSGVAWFKRGGLLPPNGGCIGLISPQKGVERAFSRVLCVALDKFPGGSAADDFLLGCLK